MRIKWRCPPTNKELINTYLSDYLENNRINSTELKYSDIIININRIIDVHNKRGCIFNMRELSINDIEKLRILNRNLYRNMRIKYIEECINEIGI